MTITELQADAYRRMALLIYGEECVPCEIYRIWDETDAEETRRRGQWDDIRFELARTRLVRLPRSQFMYCPKNRTPRIERNGTPTFLQEHQTVYYVPKADAFEYLCDKERRMWDTDTGEAKIFWSDWNISELSDTELQATCTYYMAYLYNGEVYEERNYFEPFHPKAFKLFASSEGGGGGGGQGGIQTVCVGGIRG